MKWLAGGIQAHFPHSVADSFSLSQVNASSVGLLISNFLAEKPTYPVLAFTHNCLGFFLAKHTEWYRDWKLYLGIILWVGWWKKVMTSRGDEDAFGNKFIFTFGLDLLVLVLVQTYGGWGLAIAGLLIVVQSYAAAIVDPLSDTEPPSEFQAGSMYNDISRSLLHTVVVFVGQFCFVFCYCSYLFNNLDATKLNYTFWTMAFIGLQMAAFFNRGADSLLGEPWDHKQWYTLQDHAHRIEFTYIDEKTGKTLGPFRRPRLVMHLRGFMGFVMNTVARDFVAFTIPIFLSHFSSPLDFVVYSIGVNFITTLDDMTPKMYTIHIKDAGEHGLSNQPTDVGLW